MKKVASFLSSISTAYLYSFVTLSGVAMIANTPSMLLCAQNLEIVDVGWLTTKQVPSVDGKALYQCVWHNNLALYSAGTSAIHFIQIHSAEIIIYGLFFTFSSIGFVIFIRSVGFLLTWK